MNKAKEEKRLRKAWEDSCYAWQSDPSVVAAQAALHKASEAAKARGVMAMDKAWNDLQAFRTAQVKPELDEKWIPLLSQFSEFGTEYQKWRVRELKPGFVIISVPGRKFWSSVMDPSCYAPAEHILVKVGDLNARIAKDKAVLMEIQGKLTKEALAKMETKAKAK